MTETHEIPEDVEGIIYKITCSSSGKSYVGQTLTHRWNKGKWRPYGVKRRLAAHISTARANQMSLIAKAIREHGESTFTITELSRCGVHERDTEEKQAIVAQKTLSPNGYNAFLIGASMPTGSVRRTVRKTKKSEKRKRTYDAAFSEENAQPETVLCAYIREYGGTNPHFGVMFETAKNKTTKTMQETSFSASDDRDKALVTAKEFAQRYTEKIDFVALGDGKSRATAQRDKILALRDSVKSVHLSHRKNQIMIRFKTDAKTKISTSFRYAAHNNERAQALAAARTWTTTHFTRTPTVEHGFDAEEIN